MVVLAMEGMVDTVDMVAMEMVDMVATADMGVMMILAVLGESLVLVAIKVVSTNSA
jgi:hypothetical protein